MLVIVSWFVARDYRMTATPGTISLSEMNCIRSGSALSDRAPRRNHAAMEDLLVNLAKGVTSAHFSALAAVMVVVFGATLAGYGIVSGWRWMINGGIYLAGPGFLFRYWIDD